MSVGVGIDIGAQSVKVAVLRTAYRRVSLEALASADVGEGTVEEALRAALATALLGKPFDALATGLEGDKVAVHSLDMPASAQKQMAEVLPFELEAVMPVDMAESVFDYRVLGPRQGDAGASTSIQVLAAVARTEHVRARIDLVKAALGAEPERVGVGAFTLSPLLAVTPALASDEVKVLVDLGLHGSDVLIIQGGEPVFARTLSVGTQGLPNTAGRLSRELRVTVAAYRAAGGTAPTRVYLCGGGAYVSGAEAFLARELDMPVEVLPPPSIDLAVLLASAPDRAQELPRFAKAIGLALTLAGRSPSFDLRRGPLAYERGFAWVREKIPVVAGLAAVIVVSLFFALSAQLYAAGVDQARLEAALGLVTKEVLGEETTSAARANELLSQQTSVTDEDPMPHADAFDVMDKLATDISPSITHDVEELDIQKAHAVVHGVVGTIPEAQSIAAALGSEHCFSEVHVTRTNQAVGSDRQKYVLEFDVKCPEDVHGAKKPAASSASSSSGGSK